MIPLSKFKIELTPSNLFAIFMLTVIIVSGAILFMCLVGMITFSSKTTLDAWVEINSQILNACFTLQAFMVQPVRFHLFLLTWKWIRARRNNLTNDYAAKINELVPAIVLPGFYQSTSSAAWVQSPDLTAVQRPITPIWKWFTILALLNGQWIFQYPITIVMWMYAAHPADRVSWVVPVFLPLSFLSGAISGVWPMLMLRKEKKDNSGIVASET